MALFFRIKTLSVKTCIWELSSKANILSRRAVGLDNILLNRERVIWFWSPSILFNVYHACIPWYFVSIHFPECRNYCHHSSEVSVTPPCCLFALAALSPVSVLSIQNMRRLLTPCRSRGRRQPLVYLKLILGTHRIIRLAFLQCAKVKVRELAGVRNRPGAWL